MNQNDNDTSTVEDEKMVIKDPNPDWPAVLVYPDADLRLKKTQITDFGKETIDLCNMMNEMLIYYGGIGLAAAQIGRREDLFVINLDRSDNYTAFINSSILNTSKTKVREIEGCLSLPTVFTGVSRPDSIRVRYQDMSGQQKEEDFDGLMARCIQHEMDHLDGKLFIDRASHTDIFKVRKRLNMLKNYKKGVLNDKRANS